MMLSAIRRNGLILAIFACICTGVVAVTQALTATRIHEQERHQLLSILNQVIPAETHNNDLYQSCLTVTPIPNRPDTDVLHAYIAKMDDQPQGIAIETIAPNGYNGAIKLLVGIDNRGVITGTRVLSQHETPGLGDKISSRVTDWILGFTGKQVTPNNLNRWKVKKDGGQFDQFTGATITPRAVVSAIRDTVIWVNQHREQLYQQAYDCGEHKYADK